jgi:hypothetical protein
MCAESEQHEGNPQSCDVDAPVHTPFTRLTNGHSRKVENHEHALAIHYMHSIAERFTAKTVRLIIDRPTQETAAFADALRVALSKAGVHVD